MDIYVAGKWEEKQQVRIVQQILRNAGHEITFDWTQQLDVTDEIDLDEQCKLDIEGVMSADALVAVLVDENKYVCKSSNRYVEIGIAIGAGIPVYILGKPRADFLFRRDITVRILRTTKELTDALH